MVSSALVVVVALASCVQGASGFSAPDGGRGSSRAGPRRSATEKGVKADTPPEGMVASATAWNAKAIDKLRKLDFSSDGTVLDGEELLPPPPLVDPEEQQKLFADQQRKFVSELSDLEAKAIAEIRERTAPINAKLTKEQRNVASASRALENAQSQMKTFETQAKLFTALQLGSAAVLSVAAMIKFTS